MPLYSKTRKKGSWSTVVVTVESRVPPEVALWTSRTIPAVAGVRNWSRMTSPAFGELEVSSEKVRVPAAPVIVAIAV